MPIVATLKEVKRTVIARHVRPDNLKAWIEVTATLLPLAALWYFAFLGPETSYWLSAAAVALMSLFLLRVFVLMHECGHGSLFRSSALNRAFGFVFGVVCGMPQYVWSQRHQHHHSTNGNWSQYRGPLNIIPAAEYAAMNTRQQRRYRQARSIWLAPLAGFLYLIFNPRFTWLKGSVQLLSHIIKAKRAQPNVPLGKIAASFETGLWRSRREYWHMCCNNLVLISACVLMCQLGDPLLFFACYLVSASLAGGAGILLFTVQHNFENSYASQDEGWDYNRAAIEGTTFLVLPPWLNWLTANIGYHHVHHLSARIPSYCLVACHEEYAHLFASVTRIRLSQIPRSLKCILWDTESRRIISVAEYERLAPGTLSTS